MKEEISFIPFIQPITVHNRDLNMEGNVYWTCYAGWFMDKVEEFLVSIPSIGEKIRRGEIKFQILDILVEHKSSLYMADTADFVIDGVAIRP
ncbi:MAG: hypothetical protein WC302_02625, partial [Candidatus Paceibacterota bacterium]